MGLVCIASAVLLCIHILCGSCLGLDCSEPAERVDCGHPSIDRGMCVDDRGCCWDEQHTDSQIPRCFFPIDNSTTLQCDANFKLDCGEVGYTEEHCTPKGCCWLEVPGDPYCFTKTRVSVNISSPFVTSAMISISPTTSMGQLSSVHDEYTTDAHDVPSSSAEFTPVITPALSSISIMTLHSSSGSAFTTDSDSLTTSTSSSSSSTSSSSSSSSSSSLAYVNVLYTTIAITNVDTEDTEPTSTGILQSGNKPVLYILIPIVLLGVALVVGVVLLVVVSVCVVVVKWQKRKKSHRSMIFAADDLMVTNSAYGLSFQGLLDKFLLSETIEMKPNEAYSATPLRTVMDNTYEQVLLPSSATPEQHTMMAPQYKSQEQHQYDYIVPSAGSN